MVKGSQSGSRLHAPDELIVPALEVGSAIARARRVVARSRRIPGLALLFLGAARGSVKTTPPRVPALPWSIGLSSTVLWGWAARGDRAPHALGQGAPALEHAGDRPRPLSSAVGLEAVAPALVLVRHLLGAPVREPPSGPGTKPRPIASSPIRHRAHVGWSFAEALGAARPASVRAGRTAGTNVRIETGDGDAAHASGERARRIEEGWAGGVHPSHGIAPDLATREASPEIAAAQEPLPWGAPAAARSDAVVAHLAAAAAERLPQRHARAGPTAMQSFVEVADSLRTFVVQEVREVKDAVTRIASSQPAKPHQASLAPTDDAVRNLLSRMRMMMQEERFRSGKLR
jgi:hypothetical protein